VDDEVRALCGLRCRLHSIFLSNPSDTFRMEHVTTTIRPGTRNGRRTAAASTGTPRAGTPTASGASRSGASRSPPSSRRSSPRSPTAARGPATRSAHGRSPTTPACGSARSSCPSGTSPAGGSSSSTRRRPTTRSPRTRRRCSAARASRTRRARRSRRAARPDAAQARGTFCAPVRTARSVRGGWTAGTGARARRGTARSQPLASLAWGSGPWCAPSAHEAPFTF
jgi:hypothetical protein